ncbi:hypothetical protein CP533_2655 [Ophiocordyceps camponoti-saundersi (nom. inval.)]|nr:hypothetical protein CP533_2655 [Ophiocordyceps camponoti-saundersi (nom. inval.)]
MSRRTNVSFQDSLSSVLINDNFKMVDLLDVIEDFTDSGNSAQNPVESDLCRMLSLHSVHSNTSSSSSALLHDTAQSEDDEEYRKIGAGACGVVFNQIGTPLAFKVAKAGYEADLWNDAKMHTAIKAAFDKFGGTDLHSFKIPQFFGYVPESTTEYFANHPKLFQVASEECSDPSHVLISERQLIEKYCAARIRPIALQDAANKDCLVRLYLGSLRGRTIANFFSLRNFKLHLNQMDELHLDVETLAHKMGSALAIMHWAAKTDARDVEFALGSSVEKNALSIPLILEDKGTDKPWYYVGPPKPRNQDFSIRTTELWALDFNQVQPITLDDDGVAKAINAVKINDPYFPRPHGKSIIERRAWNAFVHGYAKMSYRILGENDSRHEATLELPGKFLKGLREAFATEETKLRGS